MCNVDILRAHILQAFGTTAAGSAVLYLVAGMVNKTVQQKGRTEKTATETEQAWMHNVMFWVFVFSSMHIEYTQVIKSVTNWLTWYEDGQFSFQESEIQAGQSNGSIMLLGIRNFKITHSVLNIHCSFEFLSITS